MNVLELTLARVLTQLCFGKKFHFYRTIERGIQRNIESVRENSVFVGISLQFCVLLSFFRWKKKIIFFGDCRVVIVYY